MAKAQGFDFAELESAPAISPSRRSIWVGDNKISMLQDIEAGRRTEIDTLNLAVVERGEEYGVDTPLYWAIGMLIQALDDDRLGSARRTPLREPSLGGSPTPTAVAIIEKALQDPALRRRQAPGRAAAPRRHIRQPDAGEPTVNIADAARPQHHLLPRRRRPGRWGTALVGTPEFRRDADRFAHALTELGRRPRRSGGTVHGQLRRVRASPSTASSKWAPSRCRSRRCANAARWSSWSTTAQARISWPASLSGRAPRACRHPERRARDRRRSGHLGQGSIAGRPPDQATATGLSPVASTTGVDLDFWTLLAGRPETFADRLHRPQRRRGDHLHGGDHRQAEGSGAHPRQRDLEQLHHGPRLGHPRRRTGSCASCPCTTRSRRTSSSTPP